MKALCLAALLCLAILPSGIPSGTAGAAEPPPSSPSAPFSSEISVTVVEIPVEVSRGGEPVRGLTADDFQVLEQGKALPVVSCEAIDLKEPELAATPAAPAAAPPPPPPAAARRHLFFLFDFALSRPDRLRDGIASARRLVRTALDPSDLVGVGVYMPKGELPLLLQFTTDRAAFERTLAALAGALDGKAPPQAAKADDPLHLLGSGVRSLALQKIQTDERNVAAELLEDSGPLDGRGGALLAEDLADAARIHGNSLEERRRDHVMAMTESMQGLADFLRPVEGRKYLMLFSEGFAGSLVYRPTEGVTDIAVGGTALIAKLDATLGELRRLGWVIDAANLGSLRGGGHTGDGLFIFANKTGGVLVEGGNDLAPGLSNALRRHAHSYLLTVQVDVAPDGAFHPIEVRLRNPALRTEVAHRGGYFAPLPFRNQSGAQRMAAAAQLVAGDDERDELGVKAAVVPLRRHGAATRAAVLLEVPGAPLLAGQGPRLGLEVFGYALAADGTAGDFFAQPFGFDRAKAGDRLGKAGVRVVGTLDLPPGRGRVRLLVRERDTGRLSLLTLPVGGADTEGAAAIAGGPRLDAFFLAAPDDLWLPVRAQGAAFDPHGKELLPVLQESVPAGGAADLAVLGTGLAAGLAAPGSWLHARLLTPDGKPLAGSDLNLGPVSPGEGGERDAAFAHLKLGTLPPGDYILEVRLGSGATVQAATRRPFRIVQR